MTGNGAETTDTAPETGPETSSWPAARRIQMSALGTLGLFVGAATLGVLYQAVTGDPGTFRFALAGVDWWTDAVNLLAILALGTAFVVPHEWLHGLAIRYYGGETRNGTASPTSSLRTPTRRPTTSSPAASSSSS